ncbi:hypothetical protein JEZ13_06090 [bacterium]|nr:hypothetical protein [bacterium]
MKISIITLILLAFLDLLAAKDINDEKCLIIDLETAEKTNNLRMIENIFSDNASLLYPDSTPKCSKEAIISFYEYLWKNTSIRTIRYENIKIEKIGTQQIETGTLMFLNSNRETVELPFKAVIVNNNNKLKIHILALGKDMDLKHTTLKLPTPTGEYNVAQSSHYYPKSESTSNRTVSFQLWYPTNPNETKTAVYHSKEVARAAAEFMGLPLFFNSYEPLVRTNSYVNAPAVPDTSFPILLYNHGYGGFTSVYQSVFEDLASHGYVVVSIAHENESSLFITETGEVVRNNPENDFYRKREPELSGPAVNKLQDIILNSDNIKKIEKAYLDLISLSPLHNESTRLWTKDNKVVIEKLKEIAKDSPNLRGAFDFENMGIFGHSVGGAVAGQMAFDCPEIDAGINLDGFQFGDLVYNKLEIPFMFVSSNQRENSYLRATSLMQNSQNDCYQAIIKGFSHSSFTDLRLFEPGGEEAISLQRELILIFFNKHLKNLNIDMNEVVDKYPIIEIIKNNN